MSWKKILKNEENWKSKIQDDMDVAEGNIRDRKEKGGNVVIYEGRGGRDGQDAKEVIKDNDPKLYQKLESHFNSNPLTNEYDDLEEHEEIEEFHWSEAFLKYGMDDGGYRELSEEVTDFIESLGYTVRMTHALAHNIYISEVMWTDKVKF